MMARGADQARRCIQLGGGLSPPLHAYASQPLHGLHAPPRNLQLKHLQAAWQCSWPWAPPPGQAFCAATPARQILHERAAPLSVSALPRRSLQSGRIHERPMLPTPCVCILIHEVRSNFCIKPNSIHNTTSNRARSPRLKFPRPRQRASPAEAQGLHSPSIASPGQKEQPQMPQLGQGLMEQGWQ